MLAQGHLAIADTSKAGCGKPDIGRVVVGTNNGKLYYCDGSLWRRLATCLEVCPKAEQVACGEPLRNGCGDSCAGTGTKCATGTCVAGKCTAQGETKADSIPSCAALLAVTPKPKSGVFWVDANGGDHSDAVQTWCEMELYGGGWTLVAANSKTSNLLPTNGQGIKLTTAGLAAKPDPHSDYVIGPQMTALKFTTALVIAETGGKRIAITHAATTYPYVSPGANTYKIIEDQPGKGVLTSVAKYFVLGCEEKDANDDANNNQNTTGICITQGSSGDPSSGTYFGHGANEGSYEGYYPQSGGAIDVDYYTTWVR